MGLKEGSIAYKLSTHFRASRDKTLRSKIDHLHQSGRTIRILDMGGSVDYWRRVGFDYLRSRQCQIVVLNLYGSELGADAPSDLFELAVGDACDLQQYADQSFDLTHSNSVIEHLHTWDAMKRFAAEARRVGRSYYLQTPNFWFPIDPHYYRFPMFHWLPRPTRASLFRRLPIAHIGKIASWDEAYAVTDASRLLSYQQLRVLFHDGKIQSERLLGLTKSFIVTSND